MLSDQIEMEDLRPILMELKIKKGDLLKIFGGIRKFRKEIGLFIHLFMYSAIKFKSFLTIIPI